MGMVNDAFPMKTLRMLGFPQFEIIREYELLKIEYEEDRNSANCTILVTWKSWLLMSIYETIFHT